MGYVRSVNLFTPHFAPWDKKLNGVSGASLNERLTVLSKIQRDLC